MKLSVSEGPHSDLEYVVFLSSIGKRAEVGQMWQNSCLHILKKFVLWIGEYFIILTDRV